MPATRTYVTSTAQTGNAATYTFSAHNIGTAAADRRVLVGLTSFNNSGAARTLDSTTIGGNTATIHRTDFNPASLFSQDVTGFFSLLVTSGATADIVLNFSGTMQQCTVSVWALNGVQDNPFHSHGDGTSGVTSISASLNIPEQGVAAAVAHCANNNVAHTATGLTEDADATAEGTQRYHAMSAQSLSAETGRTITSTGTAGTFRGITAISFSPAAANPIFRRRTRFFTPSFYRPEKKKFLLERPRSLIVPNSYKKAA